MRNKGVVCSTKIEVPEILAGIISKKIMKTTTFVVSSLNKKSSVPSAFE